MLDTIATLVVSSAGGSIGWLVTKYLVLPSKVEGLSDDLKATKEDVSYLRGKVDELYAFLIRRQ